MADDPAPRRIMTGEATSRLLLGAGRRHGVESLRQGLDAVGKTSLETRHVLAHFLEEHPTLAKGFAERVGLSLDDLRIALAAGGVPEPPPGPRRLPENPTDEQRELHTTMKRMEDERRAKGEAEPFSGPLRAALKAAKAMARARDDERMRAATVAVALMESESRAGGAIRAVADPARLATAFAWLAEQPDPPERGKLFDKDEIRASTRQLADAAWLQFRAESEEQIGEKIRRTRDELYEKDPARYETPLDLAAELAKPSPMPDRDFVWRAGVCRRAAEVEARVRKAPEATLDHLLVALLRDGTDTARFLERRGVDRADWSRRLDAGLPRYAEGPRWPPADRALGMSSPDNLRRRVKPLPEGVRLADLSKEERREVVSFEPDRERRFTDVHYAEKMASEPDTIAARLFAEAGITEDDLKAETIARERNDDEWWRRRPDLPEAWRAVRESGAGIGMEYTFEVQNAAVYEARMRGAERVEHDDLLLAILVLDTDLWTLLSDLGQEPSEVRARIDAALPHGPVRTMFPDADDLGLGLLGMAPKGFSDLLFVRAREKGEESAGLRLLREHGVTPDGVEARLTELGVETFEAQRRRRRLERLDNSSPNEG